MIFSDFLTRMLAYDPKKRASAAECLEHPWLKDKTSISEEEPITL